MAAELIPACDRLGFRDIPPYRCNPHPQVRHLCLDLEAHDPKEYNI